MILAVLFIVAAYVLGSVPTGYWVARALKGIDIREHGSRSTGATNVLRTVGKGAALFTLIADISKGYLPVFLAITFDTGARAQEWTIAGIEHVLPPLVALAALIGHSKSIFLNMQGGKSAATGLGTVLALNPIAGALTFLTFLTVLYLGRIVSISSIVAVAACPLYFFALKSPAAYVGYGVLGFLYVTLRHKANIKRILEGTEPKIGQKPKDVVSTEESKHAAKEANASAQTTADINGDN